jgi:hypothetical protein
MLSHGTPHLVSLSLHSTTQYLPFLVGSIPLKLSISRFFLSLQEAENYISYLFLRYPASTAQRPILDAKQLSLFSGE